MTGVQQLGINPHDVEVIGAITVAGIDMPWAPCNEHVPGCIGKGMHRVHTFAKSEAERSTENARSEGHE